MNPKKIMCNITDMCTIADNKSKEICSIVTDKAISDAEVGNILNGAAYLFDKKPDSDNRHWKEQQEIQEYCEILREDIASKNGTVEQIKNQL